MKNYDVYGIGNALVDTEYEVDESFLSYTELPKGIMTLINEEERQRLIHMLEEEHEIMKQSGGGSAANSMVIISQLGGSAFYSCKVANDATGDFFIENLKATGIDTNLSDDRETGATGQCISMVTPDAERTMATCLGITNFLSPAELNPDALRASAKLYIEGYLVSSNTGLETALEAQAIAKAAEVDISLTLSDPAIVENFLPHFERLLNLGVDLLFCNHDEARLLTGHDSVEDCARSLQDICSKFIITCGQDGSLGFDGLQFTRINGVPTRAVDTTGAGDIFAGAFLYSLSQSKSFAAAAELANRAASLLVTSFGSRLSQADVTQHLQNYNKPI